MTKKESRRRVEPTAIEPAQPQSTCAHSPGANTKGQESRRAHGPHSTHIVCEDGDSAAISLLGTQSLEDLRGAIGMLLQPALDDWLVRIELALSPGSEVLVVGLLARPLCYRLFIEVQLTADLGKA